MRLKTLMLLGAALCVAAPGSSLMAQPAAVAGPTPVPVPVIAQAQETLSARTLVRLDQLTRELSETIGRVEALESASTALKADNERLATLLDASRAAQVAAPAPVADAKIMSNAEAAAIMATPAGTETGMFVAPTPPPIVPAIMLVNAQTALQGGNYSVAEANLTQLIWVHPASPEASEGRWLLGEARYVQSAWGTAAQAYVDYLKASPQGPRASEALLRLAGSFRQLGDNRQRCIALAEFKRRAPRPDPTLKARADGEIARMTCPPA
jgi:TolA-binding protein